jgi:tRNA(Ser,Leu) C12 N-acetylase TAN1
MIRCSMQPCVDESRQNDAPEAVEHCIKRNPGAAIETTEITNLDGAKVAWSEVKNACEIEGLTITEVCTRYKLKYPAVYARVTRGKWSVVSSIKKRAKELQEREAELTTTAAQWAKRGEAHRFLVFDKASGAIQKAKMRPPKSWKEFDLADRAARRAAGLENADVVQQTLIHLNEIGAEQPIEAELVTTLESLPCD